MASATKEKDGKAMATDVIAPGADEPDERPKPRPAPQKEPGAGFFTIYKKGQGYWTRMGTAAAALLIAGLTCNFLYQHLPVWFTSAGMKQETAKPLTIYILAGFLAVYCLIVFWLTNKPKNADFLIATDTEMNKVNWTSRKELLGSTKVVIIFMFLIAFLLFAFDVAFGYLFWFIGVLKSRPF